MPAEAKQATIALNAVPQEAYQALMQGDIRQYLALCAQANVVPFSKMDVRYGTLYLPDGDTLHQPLTYLKLEDPNDNQLGQYTADLRAQCEMQAAVRAQQIRALASGSRLGSFKIETENATQFPFMLDEQLALMLKAGYDIAYYTIVLSTYESGSCYSNGPQPDSTLSFDTWGTPKLELTLRPGIRAIGSDTKLALHH